MLLTGKENKGFLLLEIMVSVAILSIGLILIVSSFTRSIRAVQLSDDYFKAGLLIEDKIYGLLNTEDIEEGTSRGEFTDFNNRFSWQLNITKLEEDSVNEVTLEVLWGEGNKEQSVSVMTYLQE